MKCTWLSLACLLAAFSLTGAAGCAPEAKPLPQSESPDAPVDDMMGEDEVPPP